MLRELKGDLAAGASAEERVASLFEKIKKSKLNAYNILSEDSALKRAREFDKAPWGGLWPESP